MTKVCEFGEDTWSLGIHSTLPTCCGQIQPSKEAEEHQIWSRKKTGTWRSGSQVQSSLKEWLFAVCPSGWGSRNGNGLWVMWSGGRRWGEWLQRGRGDKRLIKASSPRKGDNWTLAWVKNKRGAHRTRLGAWRKLWCDRNVPCFDSCGGKSQELKKGKSQRS